MSYEKVLLIGGPRDGERMSALEGVPSLEFVEITTTPASISGNAGPSIDSTFDKIIYRRHPMQTSRGLNAAIYVFGDLDPLAALIDGYRKP